MNRATIFVGLSGGVDSAVAAAVLLRQGYRCVGVFLESWSPSFGPSQCDLASDRRDAARVAAHLNVPFLVFPCAEQYRQRVLRVFLEGLSRGLTPNPDALCNAEIKFQLFLDTALAAGASGIATGHYARLTQRAGQPPLLRKGSDPDKDQSYFLALVPPNRFRSVRFPVGAWTKTFVRRLARRHRLPNANKPDSQGLCFVGKIDLPTFLRHFFGSQRGPITLADGTVVGEHTGLHGYTIGQRHGLHLTLGQPLYVVRKDVATNTLVVSSRTADLLSQAATLTDLIVHPSLDVRHPLRAKIRYQQPDQPIAAVTLPGKTAHLRFAVPQQALTPGQVVVVYDRDAVVLAGVAT